MRALSIVRWVIVGLLIAAAVVPAAAAAVRGWTFVAVQDEAMAPTYGDGELLVLRPPTGGEYFAVGEVVTADSGEGQMIGRVAGVGDDGTFDLQLLTSDSGEVVAVAPVYIDAVVEYHISSEFSLLVQWPTRIALIVIALALALLPPRPRSGRARSRRGNPLPRPATAAYEGASATNEFVQREREAEMLDREQDFSPYADSGSATRRAHRAPSRDE
ncbi:hypothetical protein FHX49_002760 [Microbacterium endophyticum]|uniref:Signal peptidase I n=1 Tax=Microbacterium endophyticum TaxID=1526412 RepID=A0A7W4V6K5_9MICO|nr:S24/S26 family peptidase [Microbacterium endophyticum]MBB2977163.1 hypothetical protein [Microbacterium endophyticum]NIK36091.1 hypothetical protein [Microbacterium endophyticum]